MALAKTFPDGSLTQLLIIYSAPAVAILLNDMARFIQANCAVWLRYMTDRINMYLEARKEDARTKEKDVRLKTAKDIIKHDLTNSDIPAEQKMALLRRHQEITMMQIDNAIGAPLPEGDLRRRQDAASDIRNPSVKVDRPIGEKTKTARKSRPSSD